MKEAENYSHPMFQMRKLYGGEHRHCPTISGLIGGTRSTQLGRSRAHPPASSEFCTDTEAQISVRNVTMGGDTSICRQTPAIERVLASIYSNPMIVPKETKDQKA